MKPYVGLDVLSNKPRSASSTMPERQSGKASAARPPKAFTLSLRSMRPGRRGSVWKPASSNPDTVPLSVRQEGGGGARKAEEQLHALHGQLLGRHPLLPPISCYSLSAARHR